MANRRSSSGLRSLRTLFAEGTTTGLTDGQLLRRFVNDRADAAGSAEAAEVAFAALVDRHGPMVWGVCRRILRDSHRAEDAFQATFLILVRKAGSVRVDGSLGRWLYGVAHRVARRARLDADRCEARPAQSQSSPPVDPSVDLEKRELGDALNDEIDRLPLKYRCPIELCYFQGLTYDQAARQLDWPSATIKSRLARGRLRLRRGLVRRGLAPGLLAAIVAEARAAVPPAIARSTARAAASRGLGAGAISLTVTSLSEGVLKMMAWEKISVAAAGVVVALGLTAAGMTQQPPKAPAAPSPPPEAAVRRSETTSKVPEVDPRWTKSLPNGATIEVVGISPHPSGPDTWWRPDGTPLEHAPCDASHSKTTSDDPRDLARSVLVRITNLPDGADDRWSIKEWNGGSKERATRAGAPIAGLSLVTTHFFKNANSCTIQFKVAAGSWKTIQEWGDSPGAVSSRTMEHGGVKIDQGAVTRSYIFSNPIATRTGTVLSVSHDVPDDWQVRIVAVDQQGETHPGKTDSNGGFGEFRQLVAEFDLPPDQIKGLHVQARAYEKLEIPNVSLKPAGPA